MRTSPIAAKHAGHEWIHTVSEIIDALVEAGLQIEFFHEFPAVGVLFRCYGHCRSGRPTRWILRIKFGRPPVVGRGESLR